MPPALAIRAVKRTITEARQRQPTPATMYAHGVAAPAEIAAAEVAVATPRASDRSAIDCASASARLRIPCRSSPTDRVERRRGWTGSAMVEPPCLVRKECEDARRRAVRVAHLQGSDHDLGAFRQLVEVGRVLDDHPAGAEPDAMEVERRRVHGIGRRPVEAHPRNAP